MLHCNTQRPIQKHYPRDYAWFLHFTNMTKKSSCLYEHPVLHHCVFADLCTSMHHKCTNPAVQRLAQTEERLLSHMNKHIYGGTNSSFQSVHELDTEKHVHCHSHIYNENNPAFSAHFVWGVCFQWCCSDETEIKHTSMTQYMTLQ